MTAARSPIFPAAIFSGRSSAPLLDPDFALLAIGHELKRIGYKHTTVTPLTHSRVRSRGRASSDILRVVFGWSQPFSRDELPSEIWSALVQADALIESGNHFQSAVRFSTLGDQLFVHSAFPTDEGEAVFFGPDTYRFGRSIAAIVSALPSPSEQPFRILDVGAGSGAGGFHALALLSERSPDVMLTDINRTALRFCNINAALNGHESVRVVESDLYANVQDKFDLIISNPPYLVDSKARLYRHGGGDFGGALSVEIAAQGIQYLTPGGRLLLYTGSAIVDGVDLLRLELARRVANIAVRFSYEEVDPDVFGEELDTAPYDRADRIAAVQAVFEKV